MNRQYKILASGRWQDLSLVEQLANIGSDVTRALNWQKKQNSSYSKRALYRSLELIDLTLSDPKNRHRLKELTRLREALVDYFFGSNQYRSTEASWHNYFHPFNHAARINK
jgi:hypothetical protein